MSFLDKVGKGLGKAARKAGKELGEAADRAKFETEKAIKVSRLEGELNELDGSLAPLFTSIGQQMFDLEASGQLKVPALEGLFGQIVQTKASIKDKQAELDAVKATRYVDPDDLPAQQAAAAPPPPVPLAQTPQAMVEKTCAQCGAAVGSSKFCPGCGQKQE